jgi:SAM-dependent methyltransferase
MSWKNYLMIPQLMYYGIRAPRDQTDAWNRFWGGIRKTGDGGDVLWDTDQQHDLDDALKQLRTHADMSLPLIDFGCGNGRFTRALAPHFPRVVGFDVSSRAVDMARKASAGVNNVEHRVANAGEEGVGKRFADELGSANVYARGVFHVLEPKRRKIAADNIWHMLGSRGTLYLSETNITGGPLEHLAMQGATATWMPDPLRRCIEAGIRPPEHFGQREIESFFPRDRWNILDSGEVTMQILPMGPHEVDSMPSYFAVIRRR